MRQEREAKCDGSSGNRVTRYVARKKVNKHEETYQLTGGLALAINYLLEAPGEGDISFAGLAKLYFYAVMTKESLVENRKEGRSGRFQAILDENIKEIKRAMIKWVDFIIRPNKDEAKKIFWDAKKSDRLARKENGDMSEMKEMSGEMVGGGESSGEQLKEWTWPEKILHDNLEHYLGKIKNSRNKSDTNVVLASYLLALMSIDGAEDPTKSEEVINFLRSDEFIEAIRIVDPPSSDIALLDEAGEGSSTEGLLGNPGGSPQLGYLNGDGFESDDSNAGYLTSSSDSGSSAAEDEETRPLLDDDEFARIAALYFYLLAAKKAIIKSRAFKAATRTAGVAVPTAAAMVIFVPVIGWAAAPFIVGFGGLMLTPESGQLEAILETSMMLFAPELLEKAKVDVEAARKFLQPSARAVYTLSRDLVQTKCTRVASASS